VTQKIKYLIMAALLIGGAVVVPAYGPVSAMQSAGALTENADAASIIGRYQLGSGDQIKVTVYGEEDLSGEFEIDGTGTISLPLIGSVTIGGQILTDAQSLIAEQLSDGFLINPRVSIEVLNYRPFYILGEVNSPGSYPYVSGMTVLNAIALASGFTYRASENKIEVTRRIEGEEQKIRIKLTEAVLPGDILRVPERLF